MKSKPNLLFVFTDQQRRDTMRCYGNDWIQTPNLDSLAGESAVFENAYITQPVCTPSRSSIMTGLYPHTNGCTENNIRLRDETRTIAEMLPEEYRRAYYGKWHLGDEVIRQHGFDEWVSFEDHYRPYYSKPEHFDVMSDYYRFLMKNGFSPDIDRKGAKIFGRDTAARLPEEFTKARFIGREAARFIRDNASRPFALYVNFLEPHSPYHGPFDDLYDPQSLPVGPHFLEEPNESASLRHRRAARSFRNGQSEGSPLRTEEDWRKLRARYMGNVTLVDRAVGDILAALKESGAEKNTIVVFTSEHGDMMGDHHLVAKCVFYEEAMTVPLLVRLPENRTPRRIGGRFSQIDLAPTLLDLMGCKVPEELEGVSRADVLTGPKSVIEDDVFIEWQHPTRGSLKPIEIEGVSQEALERAARSSWRIIVSRDGWKLNVSTDDRCELYDLNTDPYERDNRIDEPGQRDRIHDLLGRIRAWQTRTGDTMPLPENLP